MRILPNYDEAMLDAPHHNRNIIPQIQSCERKKITYGEVFHHMAGRALLSRMIAMCQCARERGKSGKNALGARWGDG